MHRKEAKKERKGAPVKALPGYPYRGKLLTKEEVDGYFAGENIQCLLCGRWFQQISHIHLVFGHGVTIDEYRERFGLPWSRGLVGKTVQKAQSRLAKKKLKEGKSTLTARGTRLGINAPKRPKQPFHRELNARHGLTRFGKTMKFGEEDFSAILERMRKQKRTMADVCEDPGLPSVFSSRKYAKENPEFKEKVRAIYFMLPYSVQFRVKGLSPRFNADCERLHARGMSQEMIGKALGVSTVPVNRVIEEAKKRKMDADPSIYIRPTKWRKEDFEAILERMRKQKRTLLDVCGDEDLPRTSTWSSYVKKRPWLAERERRIHYTLPYSMQVKTRDFSPRFRRDCEHLRAETLSIEKIATALGVTEDAVTRVLRNGDGKLMGVEEAIYKVHGIPPGSSGRIFTDYTVRYTREDFEAILDRMWEQRRTLTDVCKDPDLPGKSICRIFANKHPEFKEEARRIHHGLPYSEQMKMHDVSPRFRIDCERLRADGMSLKKIAAALNVSYAVVRRILIGEK